VFLFNFIIGISQNFAKELILPSFNSEPLSNKRLTTWISNMPTFDDVVKLISTKESVMKHYSDILLEQNDESV
jgi:hypothetical protein